jgi:hypothetical protein
MLHWQLKCVSCWSDILLSLEFCHHWLIRGTCHQGARTVLQYKNCNFKRKSCIDRTWILILFVSGQRILITLPLTTKLRIRITLMWIRIDLVTLMRSGSVFIADPDPAPHQSGANL